MFIGSVLEEPWNSTMVAALDRAVESRPHNLDISYETFENIAATDAERVVRDLAASGKYDIILGHSTFSDAIAPVKDDYPETMFVYSGSGNEPTGGNGYWIDVFNHECTYLGGVAAGLLTETNKIGAVAAFPFPNVNLTTNAFIDGARSVNPDVEMLMTYIESWFDPPTAREAAAAQITGGADVIYASSFGSLEAASSAGVLGVGDFTDQESVYPETVITSSVARWDPALGSLIDTWWDHETNGTPYDAPMERIVFLLADGGCEIAPLNEALVPEDVRATVAEIAEKIRTGEIVVEGNVEPTEDS
jgi:basic membrane lipoprotein Med (substrate-binding protein (PBP1-ABC) superfamily)